MELHNMTKRIKFKHLLEQNAMVQIDKIMEIYDLSTKDIDVSKKKFNGFKILNYCISCNRNASDIYNFQIPYGKDISKFTIIKSKCTQCFSVCDIYVCKRCSIVSCKCGCPCGCCC